MEESTLDNELKLFAKKVPVIFPSDVEYGKSRFNINKRFNVFPRMIVQALSDKHVEKALKFSIKYKIPFALRGGRHCSESFSLKSGGMIIDQGQRNLVKVDKKNNTMVVHSGTLIGPTIDYLYDNYRLFIPSGLCAGVALSQLSNNGGLGFSHRKYGLTCDSLLEANIILANGKKAKVNSNENNDLFWALRGAGNGNFGIVTSMKFQLYPVENVTVIELIYPIEMLKKVWRTFQKFAYKAPREITIELNIASSKGDIKDKKDKKSKLSIIGQSFGNVESTKVILEPLLRLKPIEQKIESSSYKDAAKFFGQGLSKLPFYKNKNAFINTIRFPSEAIEIIQNSFENAPPNSVLEFDAMTGAISDVSPTDTAYVARDQKYWMLLQTNWFDETFAAKHIEWITDFYLKLEPYFSGLVYSNQPDIDIKNYLKSYYGVNVPRLIKIKTAVDPTNVFTFPQGIPPI